MNARSALIVLTTAALLALTLTGSAAMAIPPQPVPTCSPGPADCSGWHTSNVTVTWSTPGCKAVTISSDTSGTPVSCTASDGGPTSVTTTVTIMRDASPPSVSAASDRGPDANGWYNHGVTVRFSGSDGTSGVSSCSSDTTYAGPDKADASVSGTCTNGAGLTGRSSYSLKYDATAPTVQAKPVRKPDANGWYNHAIEVAFVGTDPVSGVDSCAAPIVYKGPDTEKTSLTGTCRDKASNTSQPSILELKYDTKPPSLARVKFAIDNRGIALKWAASKDSLTFAVVRRPGLKGPKPSTIYLGAARAFTDKRLARGEKYRYTVTAYDQAGNGAAKVFTARASHSLTTPTQTTTERATPALASPALGARLSTPPLLAWTVVRQATYYNVQLFYEDRKILSIWPKDPRLQLQKSWKYDGRTYTLKPGRYRWFVWPGFDKLSANRYGKLLGSRYFVITGK